jgi:hypothetical protein
VGASPEHRTTSRRARSKNGNSGINPQSSQEFPTEEPRCIENVAHRATDSPILPSPVDKANRSSPQLFHSVPRGTLFGLLNFVARFVLAPQVFAMGACTPERLAGFSNITSENYRVVLPSPILFGPCGNRRHSGESAMFQVERIVLWARDHQRHLPLIRNKLFQNPNQPNSEPTSGAGQALGWCVPRGTLFSLSAALSL